MTKEPRNAQHFTLMAAIRAATPQALPEELVESCIDSGQERAMAMINARDITDLPVLGRTRATDRNRIDLRGSSFFTF